MLLVETLEEGTDLMFSAQVPKNVKRCFCIDAKDRRRGIHLGFTRSGDPSQAPLNAYTGRPRMRTDVEIQIT